MTKCASVLRPQPQINAAHTRSSSTLRTAFKMNTTTTGPPCKATQEWRTCLDVPLHGNRVFGTACAWDHISQSSLGTTQCPMHVGILNANRQLSPPPQVNRLDPFINYKARVQPDSTTALSGPQSPCVAEALRRATGTQQPHDAPSLRRLLYVLPVGASRRASWARLASWWQVRYRCSL